MIRIDDYVRDLFERKVPVSAVKVAETILRSMPELRVEMEDPTVPEAQKAHQIETLFPQQTRDCIRFLYENEALHLLPEIRAAYEKLVDEEQKAGHARLRYVTRPDEDQLTRMKMFILDRYGFDTFHLDLAEDPSLSGGFVLEVGNDVYDWSSRGRSEQLKRQLNRVFDKKLPEDADFVSLLKKQEPTP